MWVTNLQGDEQAEEGAEKVLMLFSSARSPKQYHGIIKKVICRVSEKIKYACMYGRWVRFTLSQLAGWWLAKRKGEREKPQHPRLQSNQAGPSSTPASHGNGAKCCISTVTSPLRGTSPFLF